MIRIELTDPKARHAYIVEVERQNISGRSPDDVEVLIHANNRDHAARIAERAGYTVRSINMIG